MTRCVLVAWLLVDGLAVHLMHQGHGGADSCAAHAQRRQVAACTSHCSEHQAACRATALDAHAPGAAHQCPACDYLAQRVLLAQVGRSPRLRQLVQPLRTLSAPAPLRTIRQAHRARGPPC